MKKFIDLCASNRLAEAKLLFSKSQFEVGGRVDLAATDSAKRTALANAAGSGHLDVVKWLIEIGSPIDTKDMYGDTALARAARNNHMAVMEVLMAAEKERQNAPKAAKVVDPRDGCVTVGSSSAVQRKEEVDINDIPTYSTMAELYEALDYNSHSTPIIRVKTNAASAGFVDGVDVISKYITNGGDINETLYESSGIFKTNFLDMAIRFGIPKLAKIVLEAGFDMEMTPPEGGAKGYIKRFVERLAFNNDNISQDELLEALPLFFKPDFEFEIDEILRMVTKELSDFSKYVPDGQAPDNVAQKLYYQLLLSKYSDINAVDNGGKTLLHHALKNYRLTHRKTAELSMAYNQEPNPPESCYSDLWIDSILDFDAVDVNITDYEDLSPLYYACQSASGRVFKKLIQMGADIDFLSGKNSQPLSHIAALAGKQEHLDVLLDFGTNVNACDDYGHSLLLAACSGENHHIEKDLIADLLEKGADPSLATNTGFTPLHWIAWLRNDSSLCDGLVKWGGKKANTLPTELIEIAGMLIDAGANLEALTHDGRKGYVGSRTPLAISCRTSFNHQFKCTELPMVKFLLERGANIDTQDEEGSTPLHYAVDHDDVALVDILLANGANTELKNNGDKTPYMLALDKNRRAVISKIEKATATLDIDGDDMDAAFMRACKNGSRGVAELLIKSGNIDTTYVDDEGRTPLHYIAKMGMTALAKFVLDNGVDINYADKYHQTALHFAAGNRQKEMIKLLLAAGADINIADNDGLLPIHLVANRGQHDMLELFLEQGADLITPDNKGMSLLHSACHTRSRECVRVLLDRGTNPNILDKDGVTPLIISANINQKEIVAMLLAAGADIHAKDTDGDECIHIATMKGFKDMIALLIQNGSMVNALNKQGLAPLHIAAYWGYKDIFKFLLERGADFEIKTGAGKSCIDIASENGQKELIELIAIIQKRRKMM